MLEINIPDGEIIDNNLQLEVVTDIDELVALAAAGKVYSHLGGDAEGNLQEFLLKVNGATQHASAYVIDMPAMLVVALEPDDQYYHYVLARRSPEGWQFSTKLLVLPDPEGVTQWGENDAKFAQLYGRALLFAGLANINRWFAEA